MANERSQDEPSEVDASGSVAVHADLVVVFEAYQRLKKDGWTDPDPWIDEDYDLLLIEPGSTGVHVGTCDGEPHELAKQAEPLRTDWDRRIIDAVSFALVEVGKEDDIKRFRITLPINRLPRLIFHPKTHRRQLDCIGLLSDGHASTSAVSAMRSNLHGFRLPWSSLPAMPDA